MLFLDFIFEKNPDITNTCLLIDFKYILWFQVKLPFEKLIHALRNFPEEVMDPDTLLPLAYSIKVCPFLFI